VVANAAYQTTLVCAGRGIDRDRFGGLSRNNGEDRRAKSCREGVARGFGNSGEVFSTFFVTPLLSWRTTLCQP